MSTEAESTQGGSSLLVFAAATFFVDTVAKPVASALTNLKPAVEAGAEALAGAGDLAETTVMAGAGAGPMANPLLQGFSPLKFILTILGVPVKHLMEGSRKYAAELSPEAVGAVKSLLVMWVHPPCEGRPPSHPPRVEWSTPQIAPKGSWPMSGNPPCRPPEAGFLG